MGKLIETIGEQRFETMLIWGFSLAIGCYSFLFIWMVWAVNVYGW